MKTFLKGFSVAAVLMLVMCTSLLSGCVNIIFPERQIKTNKAKYYTNEEILITAKGDENCRVGVYRVTDDVYNVEAIRQYWVNREGFISGNTYSLQRAAKVNESRQAFRNFPAGAYNAILFDGENNIKEMAPFVVIKDTLQVPLAPTKLTYNINDPNSGLANGEVKVYFESNYHASDVMLYWANEKGILNDYTNLATFRVTENPTTFKMYENTIIPSNATKLIAYSFNKVGISTGYAEINLPEGCQHKELDAPISEFQVVSDIHIAVADTHLASSDAKTLHSEHYLNMCNDIVNNSNSDAVVVVGDIANSGREYEWQEAIRISNSVEGMPNIYYSLGNHDLYMGDYNTQVNYFKKYANTDSIYYEKEINGYHHLFLGSQSSRYSSVDAYLEKDQLDWFDLRMAQITEQNPNKPVFVYLHQSLYNTIAGSFEGQGWDGVTQDKELRAIIKKYPQIYMFNGHSHWDLNTRGSMHAKNNELPNVFNTASVAYLWDSYYVPTGEYLKGSQGYYIKVYSDRVMVLGRDFTNGKWIPSACFEAKI